MCVFGRTRCRQEDNIKMDIQEVRLGGMDGMELAQDKEQVAGICECCNEHSGSIIRGEFLV